jgi:hypothetical protein
LCKLRHLYFKHHKITHLKSLDLGTRSIILEKIQGFVMTRLLILLAVFAAAYGIDKLARPAIPDSLQGREDFFVTGIKSAAPIPIGPYSSMTGANAKDGNLEIEISLSPSAPPIAVDDAFERGIVIGTCKDPVLSDILKRGGTISYAFSAAGGLAMRTATVPRCQRSVSSAG